jgi:hypothetical protein
MPIQTAIDSISNSQGSPFGFKNRIINGNMAITQGAAAATITPAVTSAYATNYPVDRFEVIVGAASKLTTAQSSTAPTGFNFSTLITSSSSYTAGAAEVFAIRHKIEGFNTSDLAFGTVNAQKITLSFWVRSSVTGTFGGSIQNSAANRSYPFEYTINVIDTFEYKTITIPGDTSGTWIGATNGIGITVNFGLGVGATYSGTANAWAAADYRSATSATSVVAANLRTFYITGVQLEKGSTATSFDYRPYGTELALCQRYYFVATGNKSNASYPALGAGNLQSSTNARIYVKYPVDMRAAPTSAISGSVTISANADYTSTAITVAYNGISSSMMGFTVAGATTGNGATAYVNGTNNYLDFTAEL